MKHVDVMVIGAGPSGSVAAAYLANNGFKVHIVEKQQFPRYIIGESLLPLSMKHFEEVGLLPALDSRNFQVKAGALFTRNEQEVVIDFSKGYTAGWDWTWQVPRDEFDKCITDELEKRGVDISFGTTLDSIDLSQEQGVSYTYRTDTEVNEGQCKWVIDGSGFGGVLSHMLQIPTTIAKTDRIALFTKYDETDLPVQERSTQITFDILEQDLWMWIIPFHNGQTSIGFVGHEKYFEMPEGESDSAVEVLERMIKRSERFKQRFSDTSKFTQKPTLITNYTRSSEVMYGSKFALTGNTMEFLDPVFSSGVAFGTESSLTAAKLVARELKGEQVDWKTEYEEYLKRGVDVFRTYVTGWYTGEFQNVFFSKRVNPKIKSQITSVLAGYVWDESNPFVRKHKHILKTLNEVIAIQENAKMAV